MEGVLNLLFKLPHIRLVAAVFFIFAALFAPILFQYYFNNKTFTGIDFGRAIMVSFAIGFPLTVWNTLLSRVIIGNSDPDNAWYVAAILGSIVTIAVFYFPMAELTNIRLAPKITLLSATKSAKYIEMGITGILFLRIIWIQATQKELVFDVIFWRKKKVE